MTATGLSRSEGLISRSPDGRYLTVTGYDATPGTAGYGKGNSLLSSVSTSGLGQPGARAQMVDQGLLNMPTTNIDPATGASYGGGWQKTFGHPPWRGPSPGKLA